ncbi:MAG: hypothetical protein KDB80_04315 [Planctomycetes bacterium]|nr:hypothetical protein [Planctomycetota bacterium]
MRLTCRADWTEPPPSEHPTVSVRFLALAVGDGFRRGTESPQSPVETWNHPWFEYPGRGEVEWDGTEGYVYEDQTDESGIGKRIWLGESAHADASAALVSARAGFDPIELCVAAYDVVTDGEPDDEDARRIVVTSGRAFANAWSRVADRDEFGIVSDWDVEVGADHIIGDPRRGVVESGLELDCRCAVPSGRPEVIELNGSITKLVGLEPRAVALDPTESRREGDEVTVFVHEPRVRRIPLSASVPLDGEGRGSFRRSATRMFGPGRELLVVVQARTVE